MPYVLPQVQVFQDVSHTPTESVQPLRALIVGGNALPTRFGVASERERGLLGFYDTVVDTPFAWPSRPAGATVDLASARLWAKDALLEYLDAPIDSGPAVVKSAGYANRVRCASLNFATAGGSDRDAALHDRDVKVGDVVRLRANPVGGPVTLWTYVKGLAGDPVAAVTGAATRDASNAATQGASTSVAHLAGAVNCVTLTPNGGAYEGRPSGYVSESYTVVVTEGSAGEDFTTGRLRVLSASGTDDVLEVTPAPAGSPTAVGTRGLTVTFSLNHSGALSASAGAEDVSPVDLIAGQTWLVTVHQAFTATTATSGGTYAGGTTTTYVVEVVKGGSWAAGPQVKATTVAGTDAGGPSTVAGAATPVAVGTKGVTVSFSGLGLRKGDRFFVPVTAASTGAVKTLVLGHNVPAGVADGARVGVTLYAKRAAVEVTRNRVGFAPLTNWDATPTELTVRSGVVVYDPEFTDGGVPLAVPLKADPGQGYGALYAEYAAWLPDLVGVVGTATPADDLDALIPGPLGPENPLKYAVAKALANAGRADAVTAVAVKYIAVADPSSVDSWEAALEKVVDADGVYNLVPLTRDPAVLSLFQAQAEALSSPEQGLWRACFFSLPAFPEAPVVHAGSAVPGHVEPTTTDGEVCLCVIEDDPARSGSQYTVVRCTSGNSAFVANGVRAGADTVRVNFTSDGFGGVSYTEYVVDAVLSEDSLRVVGGPPAPQSVATKVEVWRNLTPADEAAEVARTASAYGSDRVVAVWPDRLEADGKTVEGYFLCAALAGLAGAVFPHQGLTRVEVKGFTAAPRTSVRFRRAQLDQMGGSGVWIVAQDQAGRLFNRHAVTTAPYADVNRREEMRRRNFDSVSYRFKAHFEGYTGVVNVVESMRDQLLLDAKTLVKTLQTELATTELGGQLVDATVARLEQHATLPDAFVMTLLADFPYAMNSMFIHIVI